MTIYFCQRNIAGLNLGLFLIAYSSHIFCFFFIFFDGHMFVYASALSDQKIGPNELLVSNIALFPIILYM